MTNIDVAFKNNRLMKALTGMTIEEFNGLLPEFERVLILCSKKEIRKQKFFSKAQCVSRERFLGKSGFAGFPKNKLVSL